MNMKILRFHNKPSLEDLEGLSVNGAFFENGEGFIQKNTVVMHVPNTFRFDTTLEVFQYQNGTCDLIMSQWLTRGPELWEMGDAFYRIGFGDEGTTEQQMRDLCQTLVDRGLAYWTTKE